MVIVGGSIDLNCRVLSLFIRLYFHLVFPPIFACTSVHRYVVILPLSLLFFVSCWGCVLQVKGGEDLRVDERVEQLLEVMNAVMSKSAACRRSRLRNKTYKVCPAAVQFKLDLFISLPVLRLVPNTSGAEKPWVKWGWFQKSGDKSSTDCCSRKNRLVFATTGDTLSGPHPHLPHPSIRVWVISRLVATLFLLLI